MFVCICLVHVGIVRARVCVCVMAIGSFLVRFSIVGRCLIASGKPVRSYE